MSPNCPKMGTVHRTPYPQKPSKWVPYPLLRTPLFSMHVLECTPNICTYFNVFEHFLAQIDRTPKKTVPLGRAKPYPHHFKQYPWGEQNRTPIISNSTPGASKTVPLSFQKVPLGRGKAEFFHFSVPLETGCKFKNSGRQSRRSNADGLPSGWQ